MAHFTLTH